MAKHKNIMPRYFCLIAVMIDQLTDPVLEIIEYVGLQFFHNSLPNDLYLLLYITLSFS